MYTALKLKQDNFLEPINVGLILFLMVRLETTKLLLLPPKEESGSSKALTWKRKKEFLMVIKWLL